MKKVFSETTRLTASNIKRFREDRGMSQEAMAKKMGTSQSTINAWESVARSPSVDSLHNVAAALRVQPWLLVSPSDDETKRLFEIFCELEEKGRSVVLSAAEGQALFQSGD